MSQSNRPGDLLAARYRLVDLLSESGGGRFWRAHDRVLERTVAVHVIAADDERAPGLLEAARRSATVMDRRLLRVLDAESVEDQCYVVNEWGSGTSLDTMLANNGPLTPRRAAWVVSEAADTIALAHELGVAHGRLVPENVLLDRAGAVRVIGFCVDAALHGLPPDRIPEDVQDLAGLLQAALTGRWAGPTPSEVPAAPRAHDRPLRPRQIRAGVPRALDELCGDVLVGDGRHRVRELASARAIGDFLVSFVGDPTGVGEALVRANPEPDETITLPPVPEFAVRDEPRTVAAPEPDEQPVPEPVDTDTDTGTGLGIGTDRASDAQRTEAGLPIFDDELDDVSWLRTRSEPAAPPPPLPEPAERPLFAPEPARGQPLRQTRHPAAVGGGPGRGSDDTSDDGFWPWAATGVPPRPPIPTALEEAEPDGRLPGRRSLRAAALLALALALLIAAVAAFNLGRGRTVIGRVPSPERTGQRSTSPSSPPATPQSVIAARSVRDFDPQGTGNPPTENPELAPLAIDGNPGSAWHTETYLQQLGPGGLKSGVGLVVDLGAAHPVGEVDVTLVGAPTGLSVYVTDTDPTGVSGLTPAATTTAGGTLAKLVVSPGVTGRYVTVWLTRLPAVGGGFRGEVAEIKVLS